MKRLLSWFFKRSVLTFFGVLLLSLVIWFEGPLLAFMAANRSPRAACAGS
jgi:type VI secretion system protein ImpL